MSMKTKYLLPVLAGLALASCNTEDDFSGTSPKNNYSPITFSVSRDGAVDPLTRATIDGSVVNFDMTDVISMFHGMTMGNGSPDYSITAVGENAIFKGEGVDGALVFKTQSMVNPGKAILVYPADTAFNYVTDGNISIRVPVSQNEKTKLVQPYMSDVMDIATYDGTAADNSAGYGRNYDVPLKKVGSLLRIHIDAANKELVNNIQDVAPIKFQGITIDAGANKFNTSVKVVPGAAKPKLAEEGGVANSDVDRYDHLVNVAELEDGATKVQTITSTDVQDNVASVTLLPHVADVDLTGATSAITVQTNYGSVKVSYDAGQVAATNPLKRRNDDGTPDVAGSEANLNTALVEILNGTWKENTTSDNFKGENTGASFQRILSIDMTKLEMDGTIVTNSSELIDVLKVYKALGKTDVTKIELNGTNGRFELTGEALDLLIATNTGGGKIKLNIAKNSNSIVLADAAATLVKLNNEKVEFVDASGTAVKANVILKTGIDWTIDQTFDGSAKMTDIANEGTLKITNTESAADALAMELINAENATVKFGSPKVILGKFTSNAGSEVIVASSQTVQLAGETNLFGTTTNNGIISAAAVVTNLGTINNNFEISVLKGGSGSITNIGTINHLSSAAVTYITNNAGNYSGTGYKGTIILSDRKNEVSVKDDSNIGYIKFTINETKNDQTYTYNPTNDKFNWLIINTEGVTDAQQDVVNIKLTSVPTYLSLQGKTVNVTANISSGLTDLFVDSSMRLLGSNAIKATNIYVADYILHSGYLTGDQKTTYESGCYGVAEDAVTYANGQIRTVGNN